HPQAGQTPDLRGRCRLAPAGKRRVLLGDDDGRIVLWDAENTKALGTFEGHSGPIHDLAATGDGRLIVSVAGGADRTLRVWDAADQKELAKLELPSAALTVSLSTDSKRVLTAGQDGSVRLFDLEKPVRITCLACTAEGTHIAFGDTAGRVHVWDVEMQKVVASYVAHKGSVQCLAISPRGQRVFSGGSDRAVFVRSLLGLDYYRRIR